MPHTDLVDRVKNDFEFHAATTEEKRNDHTSVRVNCLNLALFLIDTVPAGRELSTALTKLEEVMFWGNAALARNNNNE